MGSNWPEKFWYQKHWLRWFLYPFSWMYRLIIQIRRVVLQTWMQKTPQTPIIVVGNITVGGVGKTPLVIAIANTLQEKGLKVGIVSRGYGGNLNKNPHEVSLQDHPSAVGDEPLLIKQKTGCPVIIGAKRYAAVTWLEKKHAVDIIISDDGLQHYAMGRSIEIAVIDGLRGVGNGLCLPAGPLREPPSRLKEVDFLVVNEGTWPEGWSMTLKPGCIRHLHTHAEVNQLPNKNTIIALAAIGNPQRFFNTLQQAGLTFESRIYPDHYLFKKEDFNPENSFLMTEKDAVKCQSFALDNLYYLPVEAVISEQFWDKLLSHQRLQGILQ